MKENMIVDLKWAKEYPRELVTMTAFIADSKYYDQTTIKLNDQLRGFVELAGQTKPSSGEKTLILNSPRVLRGGIVLADPDTAAVWRIFSLQYHQDALSRTSQQAERRARITSTMLSVVVKRCR
jgi:hypothetical protein